MTLNGNNYHQIRVKQKTNFMSYTNEQINTMDKAALKVAITELQANASAPKFRAIPLQPATEAVIEKGITTMPAKAEVPAKTIREQILSTTTYDADCAAIDAQNAVAREEFEKNPETAAIITAKENASKFQADHKETIEKIAALNAANLEAAKKQMKAAPSAMKALKAEIKANNEQLDALETTLNYPADYDLSFEELPEFTPSAYPDVDTYFPDGVTGNFPASFIFGNKKNAGKVGRPKTDSGDKSEYSLLTATEKKALVRLIIAQIESGKSLKNAVDKVAETHPIVLSAPTSTFPNVIYKIKWGGGSKEDNKTELPITVANYDAIN